MPNIGSVLSHRGIFLVSAGWVSFITENLFLSHNRDYIISNYGSDTYHTAYSVLSTLSCGAICYSYFRHCRGRLRMSKVSYLRHSLAFIIQGIGLVGISQLAPKLQNPFLVPGLTISEDIVQLNEAEQFDGLPKIFGVTLRCPIDFKSASKRKEGVSGIERVSRHPILWSLAAVFLGSAVGTPFAAEAVAFSFPTLWALIGGAHTDHRHRSGSGGSLSAEREAATSLVPFAALLSGRQSWARLSEELKWSNAQLAMCAATVLALRRLRR